MASFTVRMVLHDAEWEDYERLHEEMAEKGFSDLIKSDDGIVYKLPDAEYSFAGAATREQVMDKAKSAAKATDCKFAALVTESKGRNWCGLKKA